MALDAVLRIPLSKGGVTLVDADFWESIVPYELHPGSVHDVRPAAYSWRKTSADKWVYAVASISRNKHRLTVGLHRLVANAPHGMVVDHLNDDGLDNRRCNLNVCTSTQNVRRSRNRSGSQFKGIYEIKPGVWRAQISVDFRRLYLGNHKSEEEAARAYDSAARKYFGEFARLNFPDVAQIEANAAA